MRNSILTLCALLLALSAAPALAIQTERFLDDSMEDFANGDLTTSTLTFDGKILAPYARERVTGIEASVVWDVAELDGVRYLATGHEGKLFRQKDAAAPEEVHKFEETALYAVEVINGKVYVGASPSGKIYRLKDDKGVEEVATTGTKAVWDLIQAKQDILVATGVDGQVLKVAADGTTSTLVKLPDVQNVLDLQSIPESDDVLAATQGKGFIARITPDGKFRVVFDPEQEEVRRVSLMKDGSIVAAVNGQRSPGEMLLQGKNGEKPKANGQKPAPSSFIVRIHPDGFVEEWWTSPEVPIHDFHANEDNSLIIAAGSEGHLFVVTPHGKTNRAGVTWEQYITRLAPAPDGRVLLATGATAALYTLDPNKLGEGIYESRALDAKTAVKWGQALLITQHDAQNTIKFSTRSGNTSKPGDAWTEWTEPKAAENGALTIESPVGRFLQYRLHFPGGTPPGITTPRLDMVRIFYARQNAAPKVSEVKVGLPADKGKPPATQVLTGRMQAAPYSAPQSLEVTWKAEDPNEDVMFYDVYMKTLDAEDWMLLEEELSEPKVTILAAYLPEGQYRVRVVARDGPSNEGDAGRTGEAISNVFQIDNRQPDVIPLQVDRRGPEEVFIRVRAEDQASLIAQAAWRGGLKNWWYRLGPEDELLDEHSEIFAFTVKGEQARGEGFVTIVVTDESGNTTVEQISLVEQTQNNP